MSAEEEDKKRKQYTTKQMGDACEMLVAAELTLAGIPALKAPDNWPGYDVFAQPLNAPSLRISVKSRTYKEGGYYIGCKKTDEYDWFAAVILTEQETKRRFFFVPRKEIEKYARKNGSGAASEGAPYYTITEFINIFKNYEDNFTLLENLGTQEIKRRKREKKLIGNGGK